MKATRFGVFLACAFLAVTLPGTLRGETRTIVNTERAPLVFAVVSPDRTVVPQSESSITRALNASAEDLRVVAPQGMVPVDSGKGTLVGYYAGLVSGLSYRAVVVSLPDGSTPVTIDRSRIVRVGDSTLQLAPWDLPAYPEPVMIDGIAIDWEEERPLLSFTTTDVPVRVEAASLGETISLEESRFWRIGGTAVRHVYSQDGANRWFTAILADGPILNDTGYHLRLVTAETPQRAIGEVSILVDGRSGPVVYHSADGSLHWVGQYGKHENFIEFEVDRPSIRDHLRSLELLGAGPLYVEVAASHRAGNRAERFSLGTFAFPQSITAP